MYNKYIEYQISLLSLEVNLLDRLIYILTALGMTLVIMGVFDKNKKAKKQ